MATAPRRRSRAAAAMDVVVLLAACALAVAVVVVVPTSVHAAPSEAGCPQNSNLDPDEFFVGTDRWVRREP